MKERDTSHIRQSFYANLGIACIKGVAAALTGSGAMLAESIHSAADTVNQLLLLLGVHRSSRVPDAAHPFGYGRALYFWSFVVALLLFSGGGVFSIYEGIHKLEHPEPITNWLVGAAVLVVALVIEGGATLSNIREINRRRGELNFLKFLRTTKDSDLIVVFGENSAAVAGLVFALAGLGLAVATDNPMWDAIGTILVGVLLIGVAIFLATEVKALLVGESADPTINEAALVVATRHPLIGKIDRILTLQQGPGQVILAIRVVVASGGSSDILLKALSAYESDLRASAPDIRWCFIEPALDSRSIET